jgi:hypothetical protein
MFTGVPSSRMPRWNAEQSQYLVLNVLIELQLPFMLPKTCQHHCADHSVGANFTQVLTKSVNSRQMCCVRAAEAASCDTYGAMLHRREARPRLQTLSCGSGWRRRGRKRRRRRRPPQHKRQLCRRSWTPSGRRQQA